MSEENIPSENSKKEILNSKQEEVTKNISQQETIEQTQNTKLETENMEVHHHPQIEKKNFKEYFLEFLMIFLAVTLGFFAESYRELLVESKMEKQFIQSFIEDLKTDTVTINQVLIFRKTKIERLDTLMLLLSNQQIRGHENDLYFLGRTSIRTWEFHSDDRTITQLENSGSLRLIRNESAADSIMSYEKVVEGIYMNQDDDAAERKDIYPVLCRMFNPFIFDKMVTITGINRPTDNPPLRSYDPNIQQDLAFYIHQLKGSDYLIVNRLEKLNNKAANTIAYLQKEYHLK